MDPTAATDPVLLDTWSAKIPANGAYYGTCSELMQNPRASAWGGLRFTANQAGGIRGTFQMNRGSGITNEPLHKEYYDDSLMPR